VPEDLKTIRNCNFSFEFECPNVWENLAPTDQERVRFCGQCNEKVYFCENDAETIEHAIQRNCIARSEPADPTAELTIGRPSIEQMTEQVLSGHRIRRERAIDESITLKEFSVCPNCGYPKPVNTTRCELCRCGKIPS